ncbi:hypothetical protein GGI07_003811 [Coemansia sp. Benny D115]|nr:hypothetical protein GGI07_003811 [Coemansia sp. Benny D115]
MRLGDSATTSSDATQTQGTSFATEPKDQPRDKSAESPQTADPSQATVPVSKELPAKAADISEPLATFQRVSYGLCSLTDCVEGVDNWIRSAEFCFGPVSDQVKLTAVSSKIYGEKARTLLCLDIKTWSQFKEELFDVLDVHSCQLKLEEVIWAKKRYMAFTPRKAIAQAKIDCAFLRRAPKVPANIDKRVAEALLSIFPGKVVSHIDSKLPIADVLSQLKSAIKTSMINPDYDGWADNSLTQLTLIAAILILTTAVNHVLDSFILHEFDFNDNTGYTRDVTLGTVSYIAQAVYFIGYSFSRVATLAAVLSYASEKWKSRAVAVFLVLEYVSMMMGNIVILRHFNGNKIQRLHAAIVYFSIAAVAPLLALLIAPTDQVVRKDGVYIISPQTSLKLELKRVAGMFQSKHMLLFFPYMLFYPWSFGSISNNQTKDPLHIYLFNGSKILVLLLGQMLDVSWTGRRVRTTIGLAMLAISHILAFALATYVLNYPYDISARDPDIPIELQYDFLDNMVHQQARVAIYSSTFFSGICSGFIELFGYWVIGSLTNDFKTSVRFVGTFHSVAAIGGTIGFQVATKINDRPHNSGIFYLLSSLTIVSFGLMFVLVRRITETNDWSLEVIKVESIEEQPDPSITVAPLVQNTVQDVKYHHSQKR